MVAGPAMVVPMMTETRRSVVPLAPAVVAMPMLVPAIVSPVRLLAWAARR